jgi:hypothetical protein
MSKKKNWRNMGSTRKYAKKNFFLKKNGRITNGCYEKNRR